MVGKPVTIRRLTAENLDLLRELNAVFAVAFGEPETYEANPPGDVYLARKLRKDTIVVLVALVDGRVVGGLVAYELEKFESERSEIYIYDLAVAEEHRRNGIATALINQVREIATGCGAWVVYVQADYGDEPAIALYRKLGTQEEVMHFDIAVEAANARPTS
jgi:aminoglycoside 3-N-acetyltransferase I